MTVISRGLEQEIMRSSKEMPVVTITGPRQSGKTTLARECFPDYEYVTLENPDTRGEFVDDPRFFLRRHGNHVIFDEAQNTPELFSYLQEVVDRSNDPGQFILTGSQNFLLMKTISQTLAGRVAVRYLLPFAYSELTTENDELDNAHWVFRGGYPRLYDGNIRVSNFYRDYFSTYVERDVRNELGVRKIAAFDRFVHFASHQCGKMFNTSSFAETCDISRQTAYDWMSVLESSFIAFRMMPYYKNYGKQLVKSPKTYFYDTGLASYLNGYESADELRDSDMWGGLFENAVVVELVKQYYMRGKEPKLYYWRDNKGLEIDFILEKGGKPQYVIEVKASSTYDVHAWSNIDKLADSMGVDTDHRILVYGGDEHFETRHGRILRLQDLAELVD